MPRVIGPVSWRTDLADYVAALEVAPHGQLVVAGSLSGDALLLDTGDGRVVAKLTGHAFGVLSAAWSPDGGAVAVGGHDGTVHLYGPSGIRLASHVLDGWVAALEWSPDGSMLAAAAGRSLALIPRAGGRPHRFEPVASTVTAVAWAVNGKRVGATAYGGVTWYDPDAVPSAEPVRTYPWKGSLLSLVMSPCGKWACGGAQDASVHLWKLWSGDDLSMSGYPAKLEHLAFRHDGRWMATACLGEITVWDFGGKGPAGSRPAAGEEHARHISSLTWEPGGARLLTGAADGQVILWPSPRKQGQQLTPLDVCDVGGEVACVTWLPDADGFVVARADGPVECRALAPTN
ncbi:PD40 domain-containing protein [soil metagenome]